MEEGSEDECSSTQSSVTLRTMTRGKLSRRSHVLGLVLVSLGYFFICALESLSVFYSDIQIRHVTNNHW